LEHPPELVFAELILQILYWIYDVAIHSHVFFIGFTHLYLICEIYIFPFWWGIGLFLVCLTVKENAGIKENYRISMDYEYQEKKQGTLSEICKVFENYILSIRF
jgi:hypothetical protein